MGPWCGLLSLTMISENFTTTEKICALIFDVDSRSRTIDSEQKILRRSSGYRSMMTLSVFYFIKYDKANHPCISMIS